METIGWTVLFFLLSLASISRPEDSLVHFVSKSSVKEDNGRKIMDDIIARSKLPRYGDCWTSALEDLKVSCRIMDADVQSKLAFQFTSCFVEMLGFPPYLCDKVTPIQECIKHLDQRGYNTFLEYFLHTQDMCFFLMNQVWQEETDKTVNNLASAAHGVTKHLEVSIKTQDEILASQQESLKIQSTLKKDNNALYNTVLRVKQVFDDFRLTADQHQQLFLGIFDKLERMQKLVSWIQGEMSLLDMFGFYFVALVLGFIVTAMKQTNSARFWLVILQTSTFMLERFLYNRLSSPHSNYSPEDINEWLWWLRRGASIVAFLICVVSWWSYQDYKRINNNSLLDVRLKLEKLMVLVQDGSVLNGTKGGEEASDEEGITSDNDSKSESDTSDYSKDSESSTSDSSKEIDAAERLDLIKDIRESGLDFNKENKPVLARKNVSFLDEDIPHGPPVLTSTPKYADQSSGRYNLRARKATPVNPVVNSESPTEFAKIIGRNLNKVAKFSRVKSKPAKQRPSFYSSGDEL